MICEQTEQTAYPSSSTALLSSRADLLLWRKIFKNENISLPYDDQKTNGTVSLCVPTKAFSPPW
jgi:hypothetical protein